MDLRELNERIKIEYDRRKLKSDVRYKALDKVMNFLKNKYKDITKDVRVSLPKDKNQVKTEYENYMNKRINGAESSVINEIYDQLQGEHSKSDLDTL